MPKVGKTGMQYPKSYGKMLSRLMDWWLSLDSWPRQWMKKNGHTGGTVRFQSSRDGGLCETFPRGKAVYTVGKVGKHGVRMCSKLGALQTGQNETIPYSREGIRFHPVILCLGFASSHFLLPHLLPFSLWISAFSFQGWSPVKDYCWHFYVVVDL